MEGAQPQSLLIHVLHKGGHRPGGQAGHHAGGVVVATANSGVEEVLHRQLLSVCQVHATPRDPCYHGGGDGHRFVQAIGQGAAGQKPRHDLDRGGGVDVGVGLLFVEGQVIFQIDEQDHPHVGGGGGILQGGGGCDGPYKDQGGEEAGQKKRKGTPTQTARPRGDGGAVSRHGVLLSGWFGDYRGILDSRFST